MKFIKVHFIGNSPLTPSYIVIDKIEAIHTQGNGSSIAYPAYHNGALKVVESVEEVLRLISEAEARP